MDCADLSRRGFMGLAVALTAPISPQSNISKYKNEWYASLKVTPDGVTFFVSWKGEFLSKTVFYKAQRLPLDVPAPSFFESGFPDEFHFFGVEFKLTTKREYPR